MREIISAGVIVYRIKNDEIEYLLLHHIVGHWDFAKGKVEPGETIEQAALRELHEETGLVKAWRDKFSDFVLVAFVPIFFTNTGLNTSIGSLNTPLAWLACGLVFVAAVAGKLGACYLGARATGQPPREAGCIAALMNTRALMALIAINVGLDLKLLTPALFTMLVIMALLTTAMCGPLLRWWLPKNTYSNLM